MSSYDDGLPIEEFIQALTSQLDRAQATMAVKARMGMPLTFAVKDIQIELRAHIDVVQNQIRIRSAGPKDVSASVINLSLTTITRPMIEENTLEISPDEPSLKEVLGDDVSEEERRRLEWAGIHSARQLRELDRQSGEGVIEQIVQIPAMRLRQALVRASQPRMRNVSADGDERLRIRGVNLMQERTPDVRIGGEKAEVIHASDRELIVRAPSAARAGILSVETGPGFATELAYDLGIDDRQLVTPEVTMQLVPMEEPS
jgi:hypothetical protein